MKSLAEDLACFNSGQTLLDTHIYLKISEFLTLTTGLQDEAFVLQPQQTMQITHNHLSSLDALELKLHF